MGKSKQSNLNRFIVKTFIGHAWRHKFYLIGLVLSLTLFGLFFRFLPPLIIANILDRLERGDFVQGDLVASFGNDLLVYVAVVFFGGVIIGRLMIYMLWKLEIAVQKDIYQRCFEHLMKQSARFHANRFGGSLVSQTNKFAGAYIRMADTTAFQTYSMFLSFVFTIIILAPRAMNVVVFLLGFSLVFMYVSSKITKRVRELNAEEAAVSTKMTGYLADAITNLLAVKSFAHTNYENKRFEKVNIEHMKATRNLMAASIKRDFFFATATTTMSAVTLILSVAGVVLFNSDIATIFLVVSYAGIIGQNLWDFSQSTLRNYNRSLGDAEQMAEILQIEPEIKDPENPEKIGMQRGAIDFNSVTFTHAEDNDPLFHNLDLHIKPGEKIGLVGHSGSGKTTLTKLLLRFSDIDGGEISIDSQDITSVTQKDLRSRITYVPQEPLMFHRSIRENIAYGNIKADKKDIVAIAKQANAHEFIDKLPEGYDTLVGERGVKLSGGQRQRVAIARAMIKNAPILLLDEATSALDSESEALIQDALWKLMKGKTAIVIAHRLSTIQKMDRIIVLDNGKILEQGSHRELIRKNGKYAELWSRQSGGFIED